MYFTVLDLLKLDLRDNEALDLSCIGGRTGLAREITAPESVSYTHLTLPTKA